MKFVEQFFIPYLYFELSIKFYAQEACHINMSTYRLGYQYIIKITNSEEQLKLVNLYGSQVQVFQSKKPMK